LDPTAGIREGLTAALARFDFPRGSFRAAPLA
jgi:hypothetical protein